MRAQVSYLHHQPPYPRLRSCRRMKKRETYSGSSPHVTVTSSHQALSATNVHAQGMAATHHPIRAGVAETTRAANLPVSLQGRGNARPHRNAPIPVTRVMEEGQVVAGNLVLREPLAITRHILSPWQSRTNR